MMCPNRQAEWSDQTHQLDPPAKGKALLASKALVEEERLIPRSEVLDEMDRMVLSSDALAGSWCFSDPFSWPELDWAGGIGTRCLSPFGFMNTKIS